MCRWMRPIRWLGWSLWLLMRGCRWWCVMRRIGGWRLGCRLVGRRWCWRMLLLVVGLLRGWWVVRLLGLGSWRM